MFIEQSNMLSPRQKTECQDGRLNGLYLDQVCQDNCYLWKLDTVFSAFIISV